MATAPMGHPNASIPNPQPVHHRPMFGALGGAIASTSLTFVLQAALAAGVSERLVQEPSAPPASRPSDQSGAPVDGRLHRSAGGFAG